MVVVQLRPGPDYPARMALPLTLQLASTHPVTPDHRYFVVRGRLWRMANPQLPEAARIQLVAELMRARREVGKALRSKDLAAEKLARQAVDEAKCGLGERGPPWWCDGVPDYNRRMARNTPYGAWNAAQGLE